MRRFQEAMFQFWERKWNIRLDEVTREQLGVKGAGPVFVPDLAKVGPAANIASFLAVRANLPGLRMTEVLKSALQTYNQTVDADAKLQLDVGKLAARLGVEDVQKRLMAPIRVMERQKLIKAISDRPMFLRIMEAKAMSYSGAHFLVMLPKYGSITDKAGTTGDLALSEAQTNFLMQRELFQDNPFGIDYVDGMEPVECGAVAAKSRNVCSHIIGDRMMEVTDLCPIGCKYGKHENLLTGCLNCATALGWGAERRAPFVGTAEHADGTLMDRKGRRYAVDVASYTPMDPKHKREAESTWRRKRG